MPGAVTCRFCFCVVAGVYSLPRKEARCYLYATIEDMRRPNHSGRPVKAARAPCAFCGNKHPVADLKILRGLEVCPYCWWQIEPWVPETERV